MQTILILMAVVWHLCACVHVSVRVQSGWCAFGRTRIPSHLFSHVDHVFLVVFVFA